MEKTTWLGPGCICSTQVYNRIFSSTNNQNLLHKANDQNHYIFPSIHCSRGFTNHCLLLFPMFLKINSCLFLGRGFINWRRKAYLSAVKSKNKTFSKDKNSDCCLAQWEDPCFIETEWAFIATYPNAVEHHNFKDLPQYTCGYFFCMNTTCTLRLYL